MLTYDELETLATELIELPRHRLEATWAYIQRYKYDGLISGEDVTQPNFIFQYLELPIIKRLYPEEEILTKVKMWISYLRKNAKDRNSKKLTEYRELRRYGVSLEDARRRVGPHIPESDMRRLAAQYSRPFAFQNTMTCRDADMLFSFGIDQFIKLFYPVFYKPK